MIPRTSRVDVRAGYRVAIDATDRRWFFAGERDGTTEFVIYRPDGDGWLPAEPRLQRAPIVFASQVEAERALDLLASRRAAIVAAKYVVVGPDDTVVVRYSPPADRRYPLAQTIPECDTCGSRSWRSIADGRIVCGCCGTIEEA